MKSYIAFILFCISYIPLFLYFWLVKTDIPSNISEIFEMGFNKYDLFLLITILSLIFFYLITRSIKNTAPIALNIKSTQLKNSEYLWYTMTYFFALLGLNFDKTQELAWWIILIAFIWFIYIKSDQLYTNPIFSLFWYSVYEWILDNNKQIMIITHKNKTIWNNIPLVQISSKIYFYNP